MTDQRIAYICDRKKCKNCNPDCLHTTDINHAANFEKTLAPDTWFERKPTVDTVPLTFKQFRLLCKFYAVAYDGDRKIELTCRRKDMIPEGCSWGICDKEHCPYLKEEE